MYDKTTDSYYAVITIDGEEGYEPIDGLPILPSVGDFVVDPGVPQGLDRDVLSNRDVYEIVRRYVTAGGMRDGIFMPGSVTFVAKRWKGTEEERLHLGA